MRYPLVPVAIAYALGIVFADRVPLQLAYVFGAAIVVTLLAAAWAKARLWLIWPAVFLAGAVCMSIESSPLAPNDLRYLLRNEPHDVILRGTLTETPYQRIWEREKLEGWKTLAKVQVTSICLKESNTWVTASGRVLVTVNDILRPELFRGQTVEVSGILRRPKAAVAPGLFDYRDYLRRIGIHCQLVTQSTDDWTLLSSSRSLPLSDRFHHWAKQMLVRGLPEEDQNVHLLWAMTLGWKTALSGEVAEPFMRSGTMHVFAVSGLHITLIAGILFAALRGARVPRHIAGPFVIALIWFYTFATGWQPSGIRSAIMSSVLVAGYSLRRPANLLNSLAAAALLILLWDPQQLFQAGFQLSFCVVLSLILFTPLLDRVRKQLLAPDPFLPRQLRPKWQRWINYPLHYISAGFITSFAAWAGSLPVTAYYFHLCNPVSLLANLLVVPISSVALACNVATLTVGWLVPPAAELLNHTAWGAMWLMVRVSEWAADLKWGVRYVSTPTLGTFVVYYTVLVCVLSGALLQQARRVWASTAMAVSLGAWGGMWFYRSSETVLTALPLEGGSAVYLEANGKHSLIDCGNEDNARWVIKPFLQARGVNRLSHFALTHGDIRHVEAAPRIHQLFPADHIYFSDVRFRSIYYRKVIEELQRDGAPTKIVGAGDDCGPWAVLHPARDERFSQADDSAIVLFADISGTRVLLLSDLGQRGQNALVNRRPDLRADIVVTGLPREGEPAMDGFLDVVQPELVVVCDSEYPASERASEHLKARLGERKLRVVYTSEAGAVTLAFRKNDYTLATTRKD